MLIIVKNMVKLIQLFLCKKDNFMSYMEEEIQKSGTHLICCGMTATDLSTGKIFIHEALSKDDDENFGLDEAARFICNIQPKEIIVTHVPINNGKTKNDIITYLELDD